MSVQDLLHSKTAAGPAMAPASYNADFDPTTQVIDLRRSTSNDIHFVAGVLTTVSAANFYDLELVHGDAANLSDAVVVPVADVVVNGVIGTNNDGDGDTVADGKIRVNDANQAGKWLGHIFYRGTKRYIGVQGTRGGTFAGFLSAVAIRSGLSERPTGAPLGT